MAACSAHSAGRRFLRDSFFLVSRLARLSSTAGRSATNASPPAAAGPPDGSDDSSGVQLSEACVRQLRRLSADGSCLRLAVDGGGCSGFQYVFSLAEASAAPQPDDAVLEQDGARVLVDHVSLGYIRGATIDYHEELIRSAFRIVDNPQSEQGCSCGASFAIKID